MITVLRLLLFFMSSLGSWELLRRRTSVHVLFLPGLTIAVQTGILFLAGLANCLTIGVILLLAAGIFGLCYGIFRDRGISFLKNYLNAGYLFLVMAGIALFLFLHWQIFYHYDNFSHWALVVRQMLLTDRFPNATDVLIQFRNYPLGSGVYIYFLTRVVGGGEGVMMFAQSYMMLTCMIPLMVFFERRGADRVTERVGKPGVSAADRKDCAAERGHGLVKRGAGPVRIGFGFLTLLAAANFFLVYNIPVQDLLVDSLLPLTGMSAFLYAWFYGRNVGTRVAGAADEVSQERRPADEKFQECRLADGEFQERRPADEKFRERRLADGESRECQPADRVPRENRTFAEGHSGIWALAGIACYMIQLVQIKNSGWFFAAFLMLWVLIGIRMDRRILARILVAAAPVLSAALWWIHCKIAFPDAGAGAGKHLVSISYFLNTASEKSGTEIGNICRSFLKFTFTWKDIWLTAALAAVVLVLVIAFYRKFLRAYGKLMLFSLVMFVIYQGFLLWMYVFSMPAQEAAYLAEAERYTRTILMAVVYLLVLVVMKMIADAQLSDVKAGACALVMTAGTCLYLLAAQGKFCTVFYYEDTYGERDWVEDMVREYDVPMGKTYCIVPLEDDGYYSSYLLQYLFSTYEVEEHVITQPADLDQVTADYIFLVEGGNDAARQWVQEHYPEQAGNSVIGRR